MSYLDKIPVCVAYEVNGKRVDKFPQGVDLAAAKPVYEYLDGWKCDIGGARKLEDLPENARKYVEYIEKATGARIKYVSVGADRESYIKVY